MENNQHEPPHCTIPIHKPSLREYLFFFASGVVVSIPFAVFFESLYPAETELSAAILIIVLAPLIEELAKVFPLFYRHGETQRSLVSLGLLIGLGFGVAEYFEYVLAADASPVSRVLGIIFHASSATITAYGVATKKPLPYYLLAVALHLVNNFVAVVGTFTTTLLGWLTLLVTLVLAWRLWHRTKPDLTVT